MSENESALQNEVTQTQSILPICPHCGQTGHSFYVRANEAKDVTWHCSQCSGDWVTSTFAQFREAKEGQ